MLTPPVSGCYSSVQRESEATWPEGDPLSAGRRVVISARLSTATSLFRPR